MDAALPLPIPPTVPVAANPGSVRQKRGDRERMLWISGLERTAKVIMQPGDYLRNGAVEEIHGVAGLVFNGKLAGAQLISLPQLREGAPELTRERAR